MIKNKIFIKNELLEELEITEKGYLDSELKLKLENGLIYQLTPAIKFKNNIMNKDETSLTGVYISKEDLMSRGYDIYMDTAIIDESSVYLFEEGFSGVLVAQEPEETISIAKKIKELKLEHKQLMELMLSIGNSHLEIKSGALDINFLLDKFIDKLGSHLDNENNFLYNGFKKDLKLKPMTKMYVQSMDLINTIINEYYSKWSRSTLRVLKDDFFVETKVIIKILNNRIKHEENSLFPALLENTI